MDPADGAASDLAEAGAGGGQEAADLPLRGHAGAGLQEGQAGPHLTRATLATKGCYSNFSGTIHLLLYILQVVWISSADKASCESVVTKLTAGLGLF